MVSISDKAQQSAPAAQQPSTAAVVVPTADSVKSIRTSCLFLGFVVGLLVQLATFGSNFALVVLVRQAQEEHNALRAEAMEYGILLLSALATLLGVTSLFSVRRLLVAGGGEASPSADLLAYADNQLAVGSLSGVSVAWTLTDFGLMDMPFELRHYILVVTLLAFWFNTPRVDTQQEKKEEEEEEEQADQYYVALV